MNNSQTGGDNIVDDEALDDKSLARLLRAIGARQQMPDSVKNTWAETFAAELHQVTRHRRRRHLVTAISACAVIGVFATAMLLTISFTDSPGEPRVIARALNATGGAVRVTVSGETLAFREQMAITPLTTLKTEDNAVLALDYQGADVRLGENTWVRINEHSIELITGKIYVASQDKRTVVVKTRLAEVRDIGTQFQVVSDPLGITAVVRDGSIVIDMQGQQHGASADMHVARQVQIANTHKVDIKDTDKFGDAWNWILPVTPSFNIEGHTAYDFLMWSVGETGSGLAFADTETERAARTIVLHGDISVRDPRSAIDLVLASTRLVAEQTEPGQLLVKRKK